MRGDGVYVDYIKSFSFSKDKNSSVFDDLRESSAEMILYQILFSVTGIAGLFSNGFVLFIFLRNKRLLDKKNAFIFNLAFVDALYGVFLICMCFSGSVGFRGITFACNMTMLLLSCIALDRYIALVLYPLTYHSKVTWKRLRLSILGTWISCFIFTVCELEVTRISIKTAFLAGAFILVASQVLILCLYGTVYVAILQQEKKVVDQKLRSRCKRGKQRAAIFSMLVASFMLCFLPQIVAVLLVPIKGSESLFEKKYSQLVVLSTIPPGIRAMLDPFIYCSKLPGIKETAMKLMKKIKRNQIETTSTNQ
ncbi:adrenocorticotropic hormone receptor-like [Antedon mediterranea]|uniref:adrenocorticotropic hormone receptor-like n=1 Tax=Antedon mediterranea TaxID=105859 RepID=UPI003AF8B2CD